MTVPRARRVYEVLSEQLAPSLEAAGMRRIGRLTYPAWRSLADEGGHAVFLSLQVDSKATDPFSGGGFRLELEKSTSRQPARGLAGRGLFYQLMTARELEVLLDHQNRVIASLPRPTPEQIELYPEGPVRQQYLEYFRPQSEFDAIASWLRYGSEGDVRDWAEVLSPSVQPLIQRAFEYLSPERFDSWTGSLLPGSFQE